MFKLEGIANRDSLPYADTYGLGKLDGLQTVLRGTLRSVQPCVFRYNVLTQHTDTDTQGSPTSCMRSNRHLEMETSPIGLRYSRNNIFKFAIAAVVVGRVSD